MAEKPKTPKEYGRWDRTCVKVLRKPSQKKGTKKSAK